MTVATAFFYFPDDVICYNLRNENGITLTDQSSFAESGQSQALPPPARSCQFHRDRNGATCCPDRRKDYSPAPRKVSCNTCLPDQDFHRFVITPHTPRHIEPSKPVLQHQLRPELPNIPENPIGADRNAAMRQCFRREHHVDIVFFDVFSANSTSFPK
uniref:Uncharacterized protein n=1 Tax=Candidatus Kentrum sp. DK TaxID=2126562 RepID=A0A450SY27_9GAMM|nr:MAG: hypothetical protein BECKDK2373B_GA0170837_107913 [Candidatus Kentron sp. DK]